MRIWFEINGELARRVNLTGESVEISDGGTIEEGMRKIGLESNNRYIYVLDKIVVKKDVQLYDGAVVKVFSFVSGG